MCRKRTSFDIRLNESASEVITTTKRGSVTKNKAVFTSDTVFWKQVISPASTYFKESFIEHEINRQTGSYSRWHTTVGSKHDEPEMYSCKVVEAPKTLF